MCYYLFLFFFDGKRCKTAKKVDFDQQTTCEAAVHWSKYTTLMIKHVPSQVFKDFLTKIMIWMQPCCEFVQKLFIFFCVIFIGIEQFIFTFVNVIIDGLSILPKISKQIVWILKYNDCIYLFIIVQIEFISLIKELGSPSLQI